MIPTTWPAGVVNVPRRMPSPTSWTSARTSAPSSCSRREAASASATPQYVVAPSSHGRVGDEAELVAADLEADVEGLVEVGAVAQELGEPRLGGVEVRGGVGDRAQSEEHRPDSAGSRRRCLVRNGRPEVRQVATVARWPSSAPGRPARQPPALVREVRLVGVAGLRGEAPERRPRVGRAQGEQPLQSHRAGEALGARPELGGAAPVQLARAQREVGGQRADVEAGLRAQESRGPADELVGLGAAAVRGPRRRPGAPPRAPRRRPRAPPARRRRRAGRRGPRARRSGRPARRRPRRAAPGWRPARRRRPAVLVPAGKAKVLGPAAGPATTGARPGSSTTSRQPSGSTSQSSTGASNRTVHTAAATSAAGPGAGASR